MMWVMFHCLCINQSNTGAGILGNAESCQGVICGKSSAERSTNYPLSLFRIPQLKNSLFPRIAKLPFARIVQLMCSRSSATSGIMRCLPSVFFVVHLPTNRVVFLQFLLTSKSKAARVVLWLDHSDAMCSRA